jgi:hypothetical protein
MVNVFVPSTFQIFFEAPDILPTAEYIVGFVVPEGVLPE